MLQKNFNKILKKFGKIYLKKKALEEARSPDLMARISEGSLLKYYGNVHSQIGQDGILQEIFNNLNLRQGFFCEFGAWDGIYLSNCRKLVEEGWSGVFIEANQKKFSDLLIEYQASKSIHCISAMVGAPKGGVSGDSLSRVLKDNGINPELVDFLSIDIDGCDLEVFEEIGITPKVILLEGGIHFDPNVSGRVAPDVRNVYHHPFREIVNTAEKNGYAAICFLHDLYLVKHEFSSNFKKFSIEELFTDSYCAAPLWLRKKMDGVKENKVLIEAKRNLLNHMNNKNI